jgi:hypothetical protein
MLIRRRRAVVAGCESHSHIAVSAIWGTESLNHPGKSSDFAPFFDRESH